MSALSLSSRLQSILRPTREMLVFGCGSVLLFLVALFAKVIHGLLGMPEIARWLIFPRVFRFIDYNCFNLRLEHFHTTGFFEPRYGLMFMYPAPCAVVYKIFHLVPMRHNIIVFYLVTGGLLLAAAFAFARVLIERGIQNITAFSFVAIALFFSYPLMVNYYLGNIEVVMGLIIGFGLERYLRGHSYAAAALFGVAGAMKIFPFIFLALLLSKRQYRQIAFSFLVAATSTLASLWLVSGSILASWRGVQAGLENFRLNYALTLSPTDVAIDHSLWALGKGALIALHDQPAYAPFSHALALYVPATGILGILLYFLRIRSLPLINQVLLLCTLAVLLPPSSHDYTLMHLYVPWAMLVLLSIEAARSARVVPGLYAAFVCLTLLLVPMGEFIIHGNPVGAQIKAILLIGLTWIGLRYPFRAEEQYAIELPDHVNGLAEAA